MAITPQAASEKWARNLGQSTESIRAGVMSVTQAPGAAAAQAKALWVQQVMNSADKWAQRVGAVTLPQWQDAMLNKGLGRIADGAQKAIPKMTDFMNQFLPHVEAGARQVRAMPKGSLEASIQRASAMIRHNAAFQRR
jgi:hypothetical protein